MGIFGVSPFETLDVEGVGELVRIGTEQGRATRPDLKIDVCGEQAATPTRCTSSTRWGWDRYPERRARHDRGRSVVLG